MAAIISAIKTDSLSAAASTIKDASNADEYQAKVAELAYYRAESRQFEPGFELEDWLAAEKEFLDSQI
jgi:hypothetical protein